MMPGKKVEVILQTESKVSDGMGGYTITWVDTETFKALLSPITLRSEVLQYTKDLSKADYILMANTPVNEITTNNRIYYEGRLFDIKAVTKPLMTDKYIVLDLEEIK